MKMAKKVVKEIRKTQEQYEQAAIQLGLLTAGMILVSMGLTHTGSENKFDLYLLYGCRIFVALGVLGVVDYTLTANKIRKETKILKR